MSNRTLRLQLLSGVSSAVVLSLFGMGAAHATVPGAEALVNSAPTASSVGILPDPTYQAGVNQEWNYNNITSTVNSGTESIGGVAGEAVPGVADTFSVQNNTASAYTAGNDTALFTVNLDLLGANNSVNGIGVSSLLRNTANPATSTTPTTLTATANSQADTVSLTDFTVGTAAVTGNSISATTQGNSNTVTLSGIVPLGYTGVAQGSSTVNAGGVGYVSFADVAVTSVLSNNLVGQTGGSYAQANSNAVTLFITPSNTSPNGLTSEVLTASPSVTGNSIAATFAGNSATNSVSFASGGQPAYYGTVNIVNAGLNQNDVTGTGTAVATANSNNIELYVENYSNTLTDTVSGGTLSITGNSVTSSASGNQALPVTGSTAVAGNQIIIGGSLSYYGNYTGAPTESNLITTNATVASGANHTGDDTSTTQGTAADLSVVNYQLQLDAPLTAKTSGNLVQIFSNAVTGSTYANSTNTLTSASTGNSASNAIETAGTTLAAAFSGIVAVSNSQLTGATLSATAASIQALTTSNTISIEPGLLNQDAVTTDSFMVQSNTIGANATGNNVANTVALAATTLTGVNVAATTGVASINGTSATVSGLAGASLTNAQQSQVAVNSTTSGNAAQIWAYTNTGLLNDSFTLGGTGGRNTIQAIGTGNTATNSIADSGTTTNQTIALANAQATSGGVNGEVINTASPFFTIALGGTSATSGSTATLTDNLIRGLAYGNTATNAASLAGTDISGAAQNTNGVAVNLNTSVDTANGQVALANVQTLAGAAVTATAETTGTVVATAVQDTANLTNSNLINSSNVLGALAYGNQVNNAGSITAGATYTVLPAVGQDPVGTVLNVQNRAASVSATTNSSDDYGSFAAYDVATILGSTIDTSSNDVITTASGNNAGGLTGLSNSNSLTVNGNSITSELAAGGTFNGVELSNGTTGTYAHAVDTSTALSVGNIQATSGTSTVSASATNSGSQQVVGTYGGGYTTITNSTLTANTNSYTTTAVDNSAANILTASNGNGSPTTSLNVSGGIANYQVAGAGGVSAYSEDQWTEIDADGVTTNSTVQVNGNILNGLAIGNNGQSTLTANATNIAIPTGSPSTSATSILARGSVVPNTGSASEPFNTSAFAVSATAFYDVVSSQLTTEAVSAVSGIAGDHDGGGAWIYLNTPTSSTAQVNNNTVAQVAVANQAQNLAAFTLGATQTVSGVNTVAAPAWQEVAAVVNAQVNSGAVTAANYGAEAGIAGEGAADTGQSQNVTTSTLAVTGNTISVLGVGNLAGGLNGQTTGNSITLAGGSWTSTPADNTDQGVLELSQGTAGSILNPATFAVTNAQSDLAGGSVTVKNNLNYTAIFNDANLTSSTVNVDTNSLLASGYNNAATNSITGTGLNTLTATAGVANYQESLATLSVTSGLQYVGASVSGNSSLSTTTVDSNLIRNLASGNLAQNSNNISSNAITENANSAQTAGYVPLANATNAPTAGLIFDNAGVGNITAPGYLGVLSDQRLEASVTASLMGTSGSPPAVQTPIYSEVLGSLTSGTNNVNSNSLVNAALGNQAGNALTFAPTATFSINTVTTTGPVNWTYAPVANVTNAQAISNGTNVEAYLDQPAQTAATVYALSLTNDYATLLNSVSGAVSASTMTINANTINSVALGNNAGGVNNDGLSNSLTVNGGSITAVPTGGLTALSGLSYTPASGASTNGGLSADAAFVLQNAQNGGTGIIHSELMNTDVSLLAGSTVANSSLSIATNGLYATAYDNTAVNTLTTTANTLAATVGLQNYQASAATTSAVIGSQGTPGTSGSSWNLTLPVTYDIAFVSFNSNNYADPNISFVVITTDPSTLTSQQIADLTSSGWTIGADVDSPTLFARTYNSYFTGNPLPTTGTTHTSGGNTYYILTQPESNYTTATTLPLSGTNPGTAATPANPWVLISVAGNISNSHLGVTGNTVSATSVSSNANSVAANTTTQQTTGYSGMATQSPMGISQTNTGSVTTASVKGDITVDSQQILSSAGSSTATANGTFGVDTSLATSAQPTISDSQLAVTGNALSANAQGNIGITTASSSTINGTGAPAVAALSSQQASGVVTATSWAQAYSPMGNQTDSTVSVSTNTSTAQAIGNNATNSALSGGVNLGAIYGTQAGNGTGSYTIGAVSDLLTVSSDVTLGNFQISNAATPVTSSATMDVINQDNPSNLAVNFSTHGLAAGLVDSTASENSNGAVATSIGSIATNTLTLNPSATLTQTASAVNAQQDLAGAAATATATVEQSYSSNVATLASLSTFTISSNSSKASATGNQATNTVTASAADYNAYNATAGTIAAATLGVTPTFTANVLTTLSSVTGTADVTLVSSQTSDSTAGIVATASGTYTWGGVVTGTGGGVSNSTITLSGNATSATGVANTVNNALNVTGSATLGSTAGLNNLQNNLSGVAATAQGTTTVGVSTTGVTPASASSAALNASTVSVTGNSTTALANGNQAVNALNATSAGAYTGQLYGATGTTSGTGSSNAAANFAVLNGQYNSGAITATANGTSNAILVQGVSSNNPTTGTVINSTLSVSGNTTLAQAIGNQANNSLSTSVLNGSYASNALTNNQVNGGAVTASATGVSNSINVANNGARGSTVTVGGNSISAVAIGNYSINTITSH